MNIGLILNLVALAFVLLITIVFFYKGRVNLFENKVYGFMLITTIIGFIVNTISFILDIYFPELIYLRLLFIRLYYIYLLIFLLSNTIYMYATIKKISDKKNLIYFEVIGAIITLFEFLLPIKISLSDINYISGAGVYFIYFFMIVSIILWSYWIITSLKKKYIKKYIPILVYIILLIPVFYIQFIYSELLLETVLISFILVLMYFTIENPDVKLLDEMYKSKEISDNANDEKSLFIYNMTQESRKVTNNINDKVNMILDLDSIEDIKDVAREIVNDTAKYSSITYDILGVDSITNNNLKVYKSKYNVKNLIKEIVSINTKKCNELGIEFITNIDHNIPELLYGDSIELKNIINGIIDYSLKYIKTGYVEIIINTLIREDICRLIININSSYNNNIVDLNRELNGNQELVDFNHKVIKMNGAMSVSSDINSGTRYKIILDQVIEETETTIKKYKNIYDNKRILVVDDSEAGIKIIEKLINGTNIKIDKCNTGKECINLIKNHEKFDLILIDEELKNIKGYELLSELKKIRNFSIKCIVLTKDNNNEYTLEYQKYGFDDYLLKPINKESLLGKIDEYIK